MSIEQTIINDHAQALRDVSKENPILLTFTHDHPGTEGAGGERGAVTQTVWTGYAQQMGAGGAPDEYERLSLIEAEAPRLFFVCTTIGAMPALGAKVLYGGLPMTVKSRAPFRRNQIVFFSYLILA